MAAHPMDNIPVRQLRFDFEAPPDPVWSRSSPDFALFINALGVHVPHFERFLVAVMREWRGELDDPKLLEDVQAIIGQESHHAFNFLKWTEAMSKRYPKLPDIDAHAAGYFKNARTRSKRFQIGFTAGYETFTFLGGMIILNRYEELMGEADPVIRALWVWHQVEEVEHGAVAFDFYKAFYADHEWFRRWMVLYAFAHITGETLRAFAHMVRAEGFYRKPLRAWKAWRFCLSFAFDLGRAALPVLKSDYHPRNHPICNDAQNPVAVAWRTWLEDGADPHSLSEADVTRMMQGA